MSPASKAGMSKAPKSSKEMFPSNNSSPALPPKPPRPSPARNGSALSQFSHGHDQSSNIKRKINWDAPSEHVYTPVETSTADSGVKVKIEYEKNLIMFVESLWHYMLVLIFRPGINTLALIFYLNLTIC